MPSQTPSNYEHIETFQMSNQAREAFVEWSWVTGQQMTVLAQIFAETVGPFVGSIRLLSDLITQDMEEHGFTWDEDEHVWHHPELRGSTPDIIIFDEMNDDWQQPCDPTMPDSWHYTPTPQEEKEVFAKHFWETGETE